MKRFVHVMATCAIALGCHNSTGPSPAVAIAVTPPGLTLLTSDTTTLAAAAVTADGGSAPTPTFTWTSLDTTLATVSGSGLVRGVRPGETVVEVSGAGLQTAVPVVVLASVDSIAISPDTITNHVGDNGALALFVYDSTGAQLSGRLTEWVSTDTTVVRLDLNAMGPAENGVAYHPLAPGTALIIATCEGKSDTARVTVVP